jgi:hypothetical protein
MRGLDFSRYALTGCVAAAMLAGCGGSQPPISPAGTPQGTASKAKTFYYTGDASRLRMAQVSAPVRVVRKVPMP